MESTKHSGPDLVVEHYSLADNNCTGVRCTVPGTDTVVVAVVVDTSGADQELVLTT